MKTKTNQDFIDEFQQAVETFSRNKLREATKDLTPDQLNFFNRMYKSVEEIPQKKMAWAYGQVMRTTAIQTLR